MQQTSKYQFNLVESGDAFSPAPLNENMEKVESAFEAADTALTNQKTALEGKISQVASTVAAMGIAGKNARIAWGTYTGTGTYGLGKYTTLTFDFYPYLVVIGISGTSDSSTTPSVLIRGCSVCHSVQGNAMYIAWDGNTITMNHPSSILDQNNANGVTYYYVVLGYDAEAEDA